jgi:adenylate kinase family enzyme
MRSQVCGVISHTDQVQRISVVGNSGSGKTTVARELAAALGVPQLELDAIFHQPGWQPLEPEAFRQRVDAFTAGQAWVVDGNYSTVRDIVWSRADTVVWLDLPRSLVMRQVVRRTLRRTATRVELWNGNREPWSNLFRFKPEESIIAWAWTRHHTYREHYLAAQADPANGHLDFVRLRTPAEVAAFLRTAPARP